MTKFEELSAQRKAAQKDGSCPEWYTTQAYQMFMSKVRAPNETTVRERFRAVAFTLSKYTEAPEKWEHIFFGLLWNGWLSPASPVITNVGTTRGMPVSCSGQYVGDTVNSFYSNLEESAILSKEGFGCSADFTDIRHRGAPFNVDGKASGPVPVIEDFATMASRISQGNVRRGNIGCYLDIEHPDFPELQNKLLAEPDGLNIGWTVKDSFINRLMLRDEEANQRFVDSLHTKLVTGRGYYFFVDKANRHRPAMYKDKGLDIKASNLCTEIMLHSSEEYTYTCVLSSMNLAKYDEWKDTNAVFESTVFLDCVVSHFLERSLDVPGLEKARAFTEAGRAIGLGVLGLGTYLQSKRIPFESFEAHQLNKKIFTQLHDDSLAASQWMAKEWGEPEWCKGYGVRNTHRTAIAPTKSSSVLMGGVSESVFPDPGMVFESGSAAGDLKRISGEFYKLMVERGKYTQENVDDINQHVGSVQHLDWLTDEEKLVFRTAFEVDQESILRLAAARQPKLCQGQSLNFFVSEDGDEERIASLHRKAFLNPDILSLYYIYSRSGVVINNECVACHA
jgi:ribonucleoside-diphosphate reductase alpha chain